jgi:hypothetical protein
VTLPIPTWGSPLRNGGTKTHTKYNYNSNISRYHTQTFYTHYLYNYTLFITHTWPLALHHTYHIKCSTNNNHYMGHRDAPTSRSILRRRPANTSQSTRGRERTSFLGSNERDSASQATDATDSKGPASDEPRGGLPR